MQNSLDRAAAPSDGAAIEKRRTTMTQKRKTGRTAPEVFKDRKAEALRRLALIAAAVEASTGTHWGDVGSMEEVLTKLQQAGHYAGVAELTEK